MSVDNPTIRVAWARRPPEEGLPATAPEDVPEDSRVLYTADRHPRGTGGPGPRGRLARRRTSRT